MKKNSILSFAIMLAMVSACTKSSEYELEKSVYQADPYYPSLPAYSEWGYNTFGAYFDRKLFIYNDRELPAKVINTAGITRLILTGGQSEVAYNDYYYYDYDPVKMSISFDLPGFFPDTYIDLATLNDTTIDLTQPGLEVTTIIGNDTLDMDVFSGELEFARAQHLLVDKQSVKVILSGYFDFKALIDGEPITVSYGRFDVGIGDVNFYAY